MLSIQLFSSMFTVFRFWYPFYSIASSTYRLFTTLSEVWGNVISTSFLLSSNVLSPALFLPFYPLPVFFLASSCSVHRSNPVYYSQPSVIKILLMLFLPSNTVRNEPIHYTLLHSPTHLALKFNPSVKAKSNTAQVTLPSV